MLMFGICDLVYYFFNISYMYSERFYNVFLFLVLIKDLLVCFIDLFLY